MRPQFLSIVFTGAAVVSVIGLSSAAAQEKLTTLRILTFNIYHGEGTDGKIDLPRQAKVIQDSKADLVCLQEVDDRTERTGRVDQTAELAKLTGFHGAFVHQLDFEGGRYGQALLSRYPISEAECHWLPGTPDRERRMAGAVRLKVHEHTITLVTTHLHHNNEPFRIDQAKTLDRIFRSEKYSDSIVIIAGDLNATPDSEPLRLLKEHWVSASNASEPFLTFPAQKPERQLDYIFISATNGVKVSNVRVIEEPLASDHRPLLAELLLQ